MSKFIQANDEQDDDQWRELHKDDPPEKHLEPVDNRSLFEKLQEQKAAKEDAFNEAAKFSNLIRRLDNDEIDFLANENERKAREEARKREEQERALKEFRVAQRAVDNQESQLSHERFRAVSATKDNTDSNSSGDLKTKRARSGVTGIVRKDRKRPRTDHVKCADGGRDGKNKQVDAVPPITEEQQKARTPPKQATNLIDYQSDSDD